MDETSIHIFYDVFIIHQHAITIENNKVKRFRIHKCGIIHEQIPLMNNYLPIIQKVIVTGKKICFLSRNYPNAFF